MPQGWARNSARDRVIGLSLWYNTFMIKFTIITLFREAMEPYLETSMMKKATMKGLAQFDFVNLRDFGLGPHKSVDDTPYGGGDGMLLRCEPVFTAIESVKAKDPSAKVILPTPAGHLWDQQMARELSRQEKPSSRSLCEDGEQRERPSPVTTGARERSEKNGFSCLEPHYIILCPHYEGYDERILSIVDYKVSMGKYVLTGGELPALIIIDSIVRLIPGVLGGAESALIESFSEGDNLEYPQYTRPEDFRGMKVPEVLLSGNHAAIAKWREDHSKKA